MLRDNLVGLIAPTQNRGTQASHDRSSYLQNPRPAGAESSLTENVTSPFQAEPRQTTLRQVLAKFSEFFMCWVFHEEISR